jgi:large subunit ribosomal protein L25
MSRNYGLSAQKRDQAGKGVARALRREDRVPAVIYGDNREPENVSLPLKELSLTYRKGVMKTHLCDLEVGDNKYLVLARDVQIHPVNDRPIHVDFLRVTPKTTITVDVPVHFTDLDNCPGIKLDKGVLNVVNHSVRLICQATSIPERLEVSLAGKKIGDALKISQVTLPSGVKVPKGMEEETIGAIVPPTVYAESSSAAATDAAADPAAAAAAPAAAGAKPAAGAKAAAAPAAAGAKPAAGGKAPAAAAAKAPAAPAKKK